MCGWGGHTGLGTGCGTLTRYGRLGKRCELGAIGHLTRLTMENMACFSTIGLVEASQEGSGESLAAGQVGWSACSAFEKVTRLVKDFIEGRI